MSTSKTTLYSAEVCQLLVQARKIASEFKHPSVDPLHLLLGIVRHTKKPHILADTCAWMKLSQADIERNLRASSHLEACHAVNPPYTAATQELFVRALKNEKGKPLGREGLLVAILEQEGLA